MQAFEVAAGHTQMLTLERLSGDGRFFSKDEVQLLYSETMDEFLVSGIGGRWSVKGTGETDAAVRATIARGLPGVAWVAGVAGETLKIQLHTFPLGYHLPEPRVIGVDDEIVDQVRRRIMVKAAAEKVVRTLANDLTLPALNGGSTRFLYAGTPNKHPEAERALRLIGARWTVDLTEFQGSWRMVTATEQKRGGSSGQPVTLLEAPWTFQNATLAGLEREKLQKTYREQGLDTKGYLHLWEQYQSIEREQGLRKARQFGVAAYDRRPEFRGGHWRFVLAATSEQFAQLRRDGTLTLQVTEERPPDQDASPVSATRPGRGAQVFLAEFVRGDEVSQTVDLKALHQDESQPPVTGYVSVSLMGDRMQFDRRDRARLAIAGANTPMPQLAALLEGLQVPQRRMRREAALGGRGRADAAFRGPPTTRQLDALDIALNTPDIALIQGPPGTGKTRVIAALEERLAELSGDPHRLAGQTLLTSAQHAAVENAASATVVFGLPAVKVGKNRRAMNEFMDAVDHWRQDMIVKVRGSLAGQDAVPLEVRYVRLRDEVLRVTQAPGPRDQVDAVLRQVLEVGKEHLKPQTRERLQEQLDIQLQTRQLDEDLTFERTAVLGLRTEEVSFMDDGPRSARKVLRCLTDRLTSEENQLLQRTAQWDEEAAPPFLSQLIHLKASLLTSLQVRAVPATPTVVSSEVIVALNQALRDLRAAARRQTGGPEAVLYDFLDALENDPRGVRDAVKNYTAVLAATCQQSDSRMVREIRESLGSGTRVFENVIIDEAARVHPLDLLIPMAQAERRIILVGDHRQLPHLLEPEVERELKDTVADLQEEALRRSLFERLFLMLQAREKQDGIPRVITLDRQYRMHPVLGKFVSDTFYAAHNEAEAFSSGRPAEEFRYDLPDYGDSVAAWLNVPHSLGGEQGKPSSYRPVEAARVAKEAQNILEAQPDLSVGIISFYAEQVREIYRQLVPLGVTQRDEDGEVRIRPEYHTTFGLDGRSRERLRIGTVDAFQGMEFDVVLLSVTRSNTQPDRTPKEQRGRYGHLLLENRLCVAMSRQQRLLIVVGDDGMVFSTQAVSPVPALQRFHDLCKGPHGRLVSS
jgi:AAA domain